MDMLIRFFCPQCNKRLKASQNAVGKKATCNKCGCRMIVPDVMATNVSSLTQSSTTDRILAERIDADLEEESDQPWVIEEPARVPSRRIAPPVPPKKSAPAKPTPRGHRIDVWLSIGFVVALVLAGVGAYWWLGQPSSQEVETYEKFLRTGNELVEMHRALPATALTPNARQQLMAKAEENLQAYEQVRALSSRKRGSLDRRYDAELKKLETAVIQIVKDFMADKLPALGIWVTLDQNFKARAVISMRERGVLSFTEWESGAEPNGFFDPDYKGRFAVGCFEHSGRAQPTLPLDPGPPSPPSTPAPAPKPEFGFSDLRIKSTSFEPPSVEFTIRLNLDGGKLLEAWASVGIDNAGKTLEVFAGAIDQGLLEVDGINFANPDPALKAQRVVMRQSASDPFLYECSVRYPKLVLAMSETEFTILAALEKDKKIVKTNASTVRVDLKTGKTQP